MTFNNLKRLTDQELLSLYSEVLRTLRDNKVVRSSNNPAADRAEDLACRRFKLTLAPKSMKAYDAVDTNGKKYQIKSRRLTRENKSQLLGAIRNIRHANFDFLVAYVFNENFTVNKIYKISKRALLQLIAENKIGWSNANHGHVVNLRSEVLNQYIIK